MKENVRLKSHSQMHRFWIDELKGWYTKYSQKLGTQKLTTAGTANTHNSLDQTHNSWGHKYWQQLGSQTLTTAGITNTHNSWNHKYSQQLGSQTLTTAGITNTHNSCDHTVCQRIRHFHYLLSYPLTYYIHNIYSRICKNQTFSTHLSQYSS